MACENVKDRTKIQILVTVHASIMLDIFLTNHHQNKVEGYSDPHYSRYSGVLFLTICLSEMDQIARNQTAKRTCMHTKKIFVRIIFHSFGSV